MCEATNLNEIKLEVIELQSEFLEKIGAWRRHFEWLKTLNQGYHPLKKPYIRLCKCGSKLIKSNGFLICRDCGFKNEIYLQCPKCQQDRGFKLNKWNNKCLACGHSWTRKITDSKIIYFKIKKTCNSKIVKLTAKNFKLFLENFIKHSRTFLKIYYHDKEQKILKQVDKIEFKFNKKIEKKHQQLVMFREKRFREMTHLGEEI